MHLKLLERIRHNPPDDRDEFIARSLANVGFKAIRHENPNGSAWWEYKDTHAPDYAGGDKVRPESKATPPLSEEQLVVCSQLGQHALGDVA